MAEPKHYQFILDGKIANDFKTEINKIGGKIQDLSDAQVVVNFDENASMANFKKLYQKLEKENSDLTVQFRYDINKAMLEHARKELSNMEIYVDKSKAEQAIKELGQQLQTFNIRLNTEDLDEESLDDLYKQGTKIADKIGKIISTHLKISGQDLFKNLPNELQEAVSAFRKISQLKTIEPLIINTKALEAQRQQIEQITVAMEQLAAKGAVGKIGTSDVDESKIEEIKKDIAEVKEDITSLKGRVDTLEDTTAFDELSGQVSNLDEKLKQTTESVDGLVNSIRQISDASMTNMQKVTNLLFGDINKVFKGKNGKQISGYWDSLKEEIEGSNIELKELLKLVGLYNSQSDSVKLIDSGLNNSGGIIGDNATIIARKNKSRFGTQTQYEKSNALKSKLDEAYAAGINVARILDVIGTKESDVILEVQETQIGNMLGNDNLEDISKSFVNKEYLEATDEQILKLIKDILALEKIGLSVDLNSSNLFYDKDSGFSFIDLSLQDNISKAHESYEQMIEELRFAMQDGSRQIFESLNDTTNESLIKAFEERFEKLAKQVQQAYAEAQDSHSPSKEFEKLENDAVDGIVKGANDNSDKLKNVGKQMAQNVKDGFKEGMTDASTALSSGDQDSILLGDETFRNDVEQVQLSLQRYKDTIAEIDKMKLEPETDESKKKIEELTQLAMYFKKQALDAIEITKFVDWGYEGGGKAHTFASFGASEIFGNPSENSMRYAGDLENWKLMRQFTREWSDGNRDWYSEVKNTFSGINEEISTIINQVLRLPIALSESEEASRKYVRQIQVRFEDLALFTREGNTGRVSDILSKYPELEQMRHLWGKMDEDTAEEFTAIKRTKEGMFKSGNDEWLRFIQTLPKAQEYLKAIGYEFKEIAQVEPPDQSSVLSSDAKESEKIIEINNEVADSYEKVAEAKRKVASKDNTPKLASKSVEDVTPEITNMDKLEEAAEEAAQAKKDFATANEGVQDSVDDSKSKLELEAELMERLAKSAREAADAKKEFVEANQLVAQNEQTGDENAEDEAEKLFDTANLLKQLDNQYTRLFDTQVGKSNDYKQKLQELEEHISKIRNLGDVKESDTNTVNQIKEWDQAAQNIIKDLKDVKKYVLADSTAISKLSGDIAETLHRHTAMPKELAAQFEELQVRLSKSNMLNTELEEIRQAFVRLKSEMKITGSTGISMMDKLKRKYADVAVYFASYVSIYDFINVLKDGIQTIRDYDIGLTEMNKVSKENLATLKEFQQESFKLADSIGTTAKAIQSSTADWTRLGEAMTEAAESAQATNILFNVSEFESIDEATDSLVAMSQAYKDLGKMDIVDIMNNVGNNFSISTDGLASALQNSASALTTAGNDINEAVALITAGNAIAQDPDSVGAGLRTISLRLVGTEAAKAELEALGEETDDVITTISKLQDTIITATKAASKDGKGFDILDDNGNYKSTFEIMSGLSELYDEIVAEDKELGTNNLNLLLESIAGKNRANIAASILQNYDLLQSVYETSLNSEGSALRENEAYLESIEGKINQLSNAWDALWINENNREVITFFLDLAKSILETVDAAGGLKTVLLGSGGLIGAFQLFKNDGRPSIAICKAVSFHMPSMSMF